MRHSKNLDLKRDEIEKVLAALPPAVIVSLQAGILFIACTPWRKPRVKRVYDRVGFIGLGPIPSHFAQIHSVLVQNAHNIGTFSFSPEDVLGEDLAEEASSIFASVFYNDTRELVRYLFSEIMLGEISLTERKDDYLAYVTYDGKIIEPHDEHGAILVSLLWQDNDEERDLSPNILVAQELWESFRAIWSADADPREFVARYTELVSVQEELEVGWLDRGMVWQGNFHSVFMTARGGIPQTEEESNEERGSDETDS